MVAIMDMVGTSVGVDVDALRDVIALIDHAISL
jgi:hypothetical protein